MAGHPSILLCPVSGQPTNHHCMHHFERMSLYTWRLTRWRCELNGLSISQKAMTQTMFVSNLSAPGFSQSGPKADIKPLTFTMTVQ